MRKLLGGASAVALLLGLSAPGLAAEGALDINGSTADGDAISANVEIQDSTNAVNLNGDLVDNGSTYDGSMLFGTDTFRFQDVVVNNYATGLNGSQQGGIAVAVAESTTGAVAVNYLDQTSANTVTVTDGAAIDNVSNFDGSMDFGATTFQDQDVVVNNFGSGWNATQQGAVAITGAVGTLFTP